MRKLKLIVTLELDTHSDSSEKIMDDLMDRLVDSYAETNIADQVMKIHVEDYRKHKNDLIKRIYNDDNTYINGVLKKLCRVKDVPKYIINKFK